jgi:LPXTG-motif cell wall-anchored protein
MKKSILILSLAGAMILGYTGTAMSQEKPKPKKDTVNMDSNAKPQKYYAVEDDKPKPPVRKSSGSTGTIVMIAGAAVIVGATVYFMMKKKKK